MRSQSAGCAPRRRRVGGRRSAARRAAAAAWRSPPSPPYQSSASGCSASSARASGYWAGVEDDDRARVAGQGHPPRLAGGDPLAQHAGQPARGSVADRGGLDRDRAGRAERSSARSRTGATRAWRQQQDAQALRPATARRLRPRHHSLRPPRLYSAAPSASPSPRSGNRVARAWRDGAPRGRAARAPRRRIAYVNAVSQRTARAAEGPVVLAHVAVAVAGELDDPRRRVVVLGGPRGRRARRRAREHVPAGVVSPCRSPPRRSRRRTRGRSSRPRRRRRGAPAARPTAPSRRGGPSPRLCTTKRRCSQTRSAAPSAARGSATPTAPARRRA